MEAAKDSIKLKYALNCKALKDQKVYRAMDIDGLINCVAQTDANKKNLLNSATDVDDFIKKFETIKNPTYVSKAITSTTPHRCGIRHIVDKYRQTSKFGKSIALLEINIKKGTAFGKDFSDMDVSFHNETDTSYELILQPKQKIKINSISKDNNGTSLFKVKPHNTSVFDIFGIRQTWWVPFVCRKPRDSRVVQWSLERSRDYIKTSFDVE